MNLRVLGVLAIGAGVGVASAQTYAADKVRFLSQIALTAMPSAPSSGAGSTGYVSPAGREYAIMGIRNGTIIVDITNPATPELLTTIPGPNSLWHENAVLNGYGYFVTDSTGAIGVQIVNLNNLDSLRTANLVSTYTGNSLSNVHTIQANPASNTVYLNGSNRGLVFLNANNPTSPVEVGRWQTKYVHDCLPVTYTSGPYAGKEIVFASCGRSGFYILDVTNKAAPAVLGILTYMPTGKGYTHSGLLTPDKKYFLINDELDESDEVESSATTHVINVEDLTHPVYAGAFHNPIQVIDHNSKLQDGFMVLSAYRGGIRIYDINDPLNIKESGYFDTYPGADAFSFDGAWGLHSGFPSGNVIISDINRGLFVVDPSEATGFGAPIVGVVSLRSPGVDLAKVLRKPDGVAFDTKSGDALSITFQTNSITRTAVDLTVRAKRVTGISALNLSVQNVQTGEMEMLMSAPLTGTMSDYTLESLPAAKYVDATGKVTVSMRAVLLGSSATTSIDMVRALVR